MSDTTPPIIPKNDRKRNTHYVNDQFWKREPISLTREQLGTNYGWKTLLILQFQYQFQIIVLGGISFSAVVVLKDLSFAVSNTKELPELYEAKVAATIYIFDVVYALDILLMIIYKNITWHEIDYLYSERPGYIVILEFLSVLPYEIQLTPDNPVFHYMRARYVLRVVRIVYISKLTSKMSMENTGLKLFINFSNRIFVLTFIFTFIVAVSYSMTEKVHLTTEIFHNIMIVTSSRVTNKGFGEATNLKTSIHYYEYTILTYIHLISFIIVSYQVCYYACILVPGMKHASKFAHRFEEINLILKRWKNDVDMKNFHLSFKKTVLNYFRMSWQKNKRQFHRYVPSEIVPDIIVKEIALDVTWDAFKHSHLFKNVSVSFLRSLSVFMQRNVYYPGEIVIKKNMMKSSMVYVISGIIQILSEENGETPIMSLSGGSCIGESSLFIDYPSTCTVVAKSCTEVYTLKRKNVISICKFYPDIYRQLTKKITRRYKKAKLYQRAFQILKRKYQLIDDIDFLPIYYVIKTLRGFGKTDRIINREHQRLSSILDDFVFCADYLDLLVLPDELHLVSDTVFVSETFPFIFQPNSVFIEMWNFIVGFIACIMVILYPLAVCSIAGEKFTRYVMLIILIISFIWIIDAYIRVSTAVNTKHAFHTKMSDIFYYRLSTMGFLVDILCCIPVGPVLYIINTTMSTHTLLLLEIHKLLKVYRINDAVQKLTELNTKKMMIITYLKILSILFLLFYYSTCIFYLLVCQKDCNKTFLGYLESFYEIEQTNAPERFILLYTLASYFVSDTSVFSFMDVLPYNHFFIVLFMQIFYCCIYIYAQSIVIAAEVSTSQETFEFKEYMSNVDVMFAKVKFPEETNKKVFKYLKKQYYLDKGVSFLYDDAVCKEMTKNLHILYKYIMFGKHVNDILIFSDLQNNLLMEIARRSDINTYLSGEVICYAGEVCKYMYFIICGFCKVIYRNGVEKVITVKDSISSFELCMEIPHINTVIACTDCKLLALNSKEFSYVLKWHPELKREFDEMRNQTDTIAINRLLAEEVKRIPPKPVYKKKSFKYFKFTKKKSDNMDFHVGFPKLWIIFKYLLMRATIIPDSKFLIAFELFRGIFAFFSNALSATAVFYQTSAIFYSLIALDIISWIDIYVMHHVCYYNANGLLVFHPLSTAKYYWKNRFMFDFIACLPIDYLFLDHYLYIYLRLNRFLQLYRVLMVLKHLDLRQLSNTHFFDIMKYLPLAILSIYYLSSVILISTCMTPKFQLKNSVECATGYFVTKRMPNATYAPSNALVANFLLTVMSFAMINTTKIRLEQVKEMIMYSFVVLIGTGFSIWLTAKVVAGNFFRNSDLTSYQQEMKNLINFYSFRKIDKKIKREVINHFEFMWVKKSGKNVNHVMDYFKPCFKEDVLYSKFSKSLASTSVFYNAPTSFFKCLIVEMNHQVFLKRATMYRVNDIVNDIYFILNGEVEVLGADHNRLKVLREGSIFGNLGKETYTRQLLIMAARSNLEVLIIESKTFHEIISNYASLNDHFQELTLVNVDFLQNEFTSIERIHETTSTILAIKKKKFYDFYFTCSPLIKNYEAVHIANNVLMIISCLIGFHYEGYQKAVMDTDWYKLSILHLMDLLFIIRMFLKLHTIYIDVYGISVRNKKDIIINYVKQEPGLYFDILVGAPFDLFGYCFVWSQYFPIIFNALRLVKLLRIHLVVNILDKIQEKLHINVALIRVLYILTVTSIYVQIMGICFFYSRYFTVPTLVPPLNSKSMLYLNSIFVIACTTFGAPLTNLGIQYTFAVSLLCVLITILGRFIVTLFIAETCAILEAINKSRNSYKEFALDVKEYMETYDVSIPLNREIIVYVNLLWSNYRGVLNPLLLEKTPYYLKEATLNAMFGYHLRNHPVIKNFHIDLIRQMAACMKVIIFFPGNHVVYQGDVDQTMYFLHEGVIDALTEDSLEKETIALSLESGDSFGLEQGLFPGTPHMYTYKVRQPTVLISLQRKSWFHLLSFFPASAEILDLYYTDPIDSYDENIKNYLY